ncbi:glucose 1-dehydrogenase [Baekduia soli]|uniref:Glucose 1-dehydrogenase n=1 Tax=Baekduia soli TaxID=496014 RepID=A0A5B8U9J1_9ACTN|nr:glucose 1-dehydrogenase [Baekduia soli]QEC49720.1 glucose 1-dehydrogenase [Baekduia soli]
MTDATTVGGQAQRLAGKTAIITGGASGIGLCAVKRFLAEGANVVSVDLNDDAVQASVKGAGDKAFGKAVDITDPDGVEALVAETIDRFGKLDIYYNNAGIPQIACNVEDLELDEFRRQCEVNLTGCFIAAKTVIPRFKAQGSGVLLFTASVSGLRPRPQLAGYTAAKAGAIGLAKQIAIEVAEHNIRVNAVCPVSTDTPMLKQFGVGDHTTAKATPMGRLSQPEESAAAAAWLASDDASFITGHAFAVDGGRSI